MSEVQFSYAFNKMITCLHKFFEVQKKLDEQINSYKTLLEQEEIENSDIEKIKNSIESCKPYIEFMRMLEENRDVTDENIRDKWARYCQKENLLAVLQEFKWTEEEIKISIEDIEFAINSKELIDKYINLLNLKMEIDSYSEKKFKQLLKEHFKNKKEVCVKIFQQLVMNGIEVEKIEQEKKVTKKEFLKLSTNIDCIINNYKLLWLKIYEDPRFPFFLLQMSKELRNEYEKKSNSVIKYIRLMKSDGSNLLVYLKNSPKEYIEFVKKGIAEEAEEVNKTMLWYRFIAYCLETIKRNGKKELDQEVLDEVNSKVKKPIENLTLNMVNNKMQKFYIEFFEFKSQIIKAEIKGNISEQIANDMNCLNEKFQEAKYADVEKIIKIPDNKKGKSAGDGSCFVHSVLAHMTQEEFNDIKKWVDENKKYSIGSKPYLETVRELRPKDSEQVCYMRSAIALKMSENATWVDKKIKNEDTLNEIMTVLGYSVKINKGNGLENTSFGWIGFSELVIMAVLQLLQRDVLCVCPGNNQQISGYIYNSLNVDKENLSFGLHHLSQIDIKNIENENKYIADKINNCKSNKCVCIHFDGNSHFIPLGEKDMTDEGKFQPIILSASELMKNLKKKYPQIQKFLNEAYLKKFTTDLKLDTNKFEVFVSKIVLDENLILFLEKCPRCIFLLFDYYEDDKFNTFTQNLLHMSNKFFPDGFLNDFWLEFYKLSYTVREQVFNLLNNENGQYVFPTIYQIVLKKKIKKNEIFELKNVEKINTVIVCKKKLLLSFYHAIGIKDRWYKKMVKPFEERYPNFCKFIKFFNGNELNFFADVINKSNDKKVLAKLYKISFKKITKLLNSVFVYLNSLIEQFECNQINLIKNLILDIFIVALKKEPFNFEKLSKILTIFPHVLRNSNYFDLFIKNPNNFVKQFDEIIAKLDKINESEYLQLINDPNKFLEKNSPKLNEKTLSRKPLLQEEQLQNFS